MAVGPMKHGRRFGSHWGHWVAGFLTIAVAAWAGVTFLPSIWTKIQGLFTKSAGA